jgi:hypothetical protein
MTRAIALIFILIAAVTLSIGQTVARPSPEKEIEALKLLGNAGKGGMTNECSSLSAGLETQKVIREWLTKKDWAETIQATAKKVAQIGQGCAKQAVYFPVENHTDIEKITGIMGKEDKTETGEINLSDKKVKMTWYTYGWLQFGAEDGKVTVMRIDFKKSGV